MMENNKTSQKLSEFYSIFPWPDSPETKEGKNYYVRTLKFMEKLIEHRWIKDLFKKKKSEYWNSAAVLDSAQSH